MLNLLEQDDSRSEVRMVAGKGRTGCGPALIIE